MKSESSAFMKAATISPVSFKLKFMARRSEQAFTRIELCMLLFSFFVLLSLALPALANKARSQQITCFNNLRQIGRAFHLWGNDHDNSFPMYVPVSQGGTKLDWPGTRSTAAWFQFGALSNELSTPKILACPADNKRPASEFSTDPEKGLLHQNFRNSAVSYFLGHPFWRYPADILSGDRNLRLNSWGVSCSIYGSGVGAISIQNATTVTWTNNIHVNMGHLLRVDGGVLQVDNVGLPRFVRNIPEDNGTIHLLLP